MLVMPVGRARLSKAVQPENAARPMLETLSGMVRLLKSLQPENALAPMLVTPSGMVRSVKPEQLKNAVAPIFVTLPSVGISLFTHPTSRVLLLASIRQSPVLWYTAFHSSTEMLVKPVQPWNAEESMLVTLSGMARLVKPLQSSNA